MTSRYHVQMEIQGVDKNKLDYFPYSGLRVLGGLQIGIGLITIALGTFDVGLVMAVRESERKTMTSRNDVTTFDAVVTMSITGTPIWCGIWFVLTGGIGSCVARGRPQSLQFLKNTFLILNILCATLFAPGCGAVACSISYLRQSVEHADFRWLVSLCVGFLSLCELVVATVSAAMCCCCSPVHATKVHVMFAEPQVPPESSREPEVFKVTAREESTQTRSIYLVKSRTYGIEYREAEPSYSSYNMLKKWALPGEGEFSDKATDIHW